MLEGSEINLQMIQMLLKGRELDEQVIEASILTGSFHEGNLQILIDDEQLSKISLDAKYQCTIKMENENLRCEGVITDRFQGECGSTITFRIENGFYKL